MDVRDAIEQAYRNGYEAGVKSVTDNNVGGKWIPVAERLPEDEGYYLCNVASFAFPGTFFVTLLKYYVDGGFIDDVTHWMPLPEPPKGE